MRSLICLLLAYIAAAPLTSTISFDLEATEWTNLWTYFWWAFGWMFWAFLLTLVAGGASR